MAVDKLVDSGQLDSDLTSVANAIRTKGGTSAQLAFPNGFVSAIDAIPTGGGDNIPALLANELVNYIATGVTAIKRSYAFRGQTNLETAYFPDLTSISYGAPQNFYGCMKLREIAMPECVCGDGASSTFQTDDKLETADLGLCIRLGGNDFNGCAKLTNLILRKTSVVTLASTNVFTGTPFASGGAGGTIYVPQSLIESYKTASNWSTIHGYGTINWQKIEGSPYESLTWWED